MKSEFGRGYAVCLRQFLWHEPRLSEYVEQYVKLHAVHGDLFTPEGAIEMWSDGAVDHLAELIRPRRWVTASDWVAAKEVRDAMFAAKWFSFADRPYPPKDEASVRALLAEAERLLRAYAEAAGRPYPETFTEAWDLDIAAGIRPLRGDAATCEAPISLRGSL